NAIEARINSIKGDDFSNTLFVDDSPPSKNNVSTARDDNITPGLISLNPNTQ
ncbi:hypothetical protein MKW94_029557, partial [Papaver nudicaule]|nr:hypothetical protein [Papaver nudicaule]